MTELVFSSLGKSGTSGFEIRNFRVCPENPRMGQRLDRPRKLDSFARDNNYGLNVGILPKESNRSNLGKEIRQKEWFCTVAHGGRVWNRFRRVDPEPLDWNHQEPTFAPWNPWSNRRIAPKSPLSNSRSVGWYVKEWMRGERVSHRLNSDIPVEIRNFRV